MADIRLLFDEMNRYKAERDKADDEVERLRKKSIPFMVESWRRAQKALREEIAEWRERSKGAEYDCGLLRAEIEALEAEIELCPDQGYHANPFGLEPIPGGAIGANQGPEWD